MSQPIINNATTYLESSHSQSYTESHNFKATGINIGVNFTERSGSFNFRQAKGSSNIAMNLEQRDKLIATKETPEAAFEIMAHNTKMSSIKAERHNEALHGITSQPKPSGNFAQLMNNTTDK